jgi:uncharacterized membrane protein HdeD (DUF308 family)
MATTSMPEQLREFRSLWWLFMIFGVLTFAAGIIVLVWPSISLLTLTVVLGIFLLVDGIFETVAAIRAKGEEGRGMLALLGALSIIAGLLMMSLPGESLVALVLIMGAWFVAAGIVRFVHAFSDHEGRTGNILIGILDVIAGVIILAWPGIGLKTMAIVVGIILIIRGVAFLFGGWQLRKLPKADDAVPPPPAAPATA